MVIFCGDIHGDWKSFVSIIKEKDLRDAHIVICGDIGIGFKGDRKKEEKELLYWSKSLNTRGINVYCLRGNHDDPSYFDNSKYDMIKLVKDYSILELDDRSILCVGGGASIDKSERTEGKDFWIDELPVYDKETLSKIKNIDIIATHACPDMLFPFIRNAGLDPYLYRYVNLEKVALNQVRVDIKDKGLKKWFFGHYHHPIISHEEGIDYRGLGINEFLKLEVCIK